MNKMIGIVFMIVGVAAATWGYGVYDSAGSQLTRAFSGDAPLDAWAGMIGGAILTLVGITKVK